MKTNCCFVRKVDKFVDIFTSLPDDEMLLFKFVPFSERKGYTAVKKCLKFVCLSVCPSQSETSFSIFRLFDVLIKLCYGLSMSRNANPRSDFPAELPLVRNATNQKRAFLFLIFSVF
jgi:hypothetical protein